MLKLNDFPMRDEDFCVFDPVEVSASFFNETGFQILKIIQQLDGIHEEDLYQICPISMREPVRQFVNSCLTQKVLIKTPD